MKDVTRRIELYYQQTRLIGVASATRRDISVSMVEPFFGASRGLHMAPFYPFFYTEGDALTPRGIQTAEYLLEEIFSREVARQKTRLELADLLDRRRQEISEHVMASARQVQDQLAPSSPLDDQAFFALWRALRKDLRAGLPQKVYQRRLRQLNQRREASHRGHALLLRRVIEILAPDVPDVADVLEAVVEGLELPRCRHCRSMARWSLAVEA